MRVFNNIRLFRRILDRFNSIERRITGASLLLMFGLVLAKALGFVKLRLYLHFWGVGEKLDIFYGASAVPDTLANFIITGILSVTLVPFFVKYAKKERMAGTAFALSLLVGGIWLVLGAFVVALLFVAPNSGLVLNILSLGFGVQKVTILQYLVRFRLLVAMLFVGSFFMVMANVIVFYLQSKRYFLVTSLTGALFNIGVISALLAWYPVYDGRLLTLGLAILTASVLVYLFMLIIFRRYGGNIDYVSGIRQIFRRSFYNEIVKLLESSSFRALTILLEQLAYFVTVFWIMGVGAGTLTMFKLAEALRLLFVHIVVLAVAQASLPTFSAYVKQGQYEMFRYKLLRLLRLMGVALVLATVGYIVLGKWLIVLLIGRGEVEHLLVIYRMLLWSIPLLYGQSFLTVLARIYYAMDRYKPVLAVSTISFVGRFIIAIPISLVFVRASELGMFKAYGYIFGVGIVYLLQALILMVKLGNVGKEYTS